MADRKGIMRKSPCSYNRSSVRDENFEEEDMWSYAKEKEDSSPTLRKSKDYGGSSSSAWRVSTTPRIIPKVSNLTSHETKMAQQSSAPVKIPDWSKIYGKCATSTNGSWVYDGNGIGDSTGYEHGDYHHSDGGGDDDGDGDDDMVPPHEWLARKLARSQISSFSVCEGMGRTLKGRDLSRVRNAVLTKTGFLE
ncbi:hypothetical protein SLEP1_g26719 [Rubroshorea leprosula]|uniref:Senescence regulator n=1 Tax=Rubroshorea leprosula TaxID=152421 RepID=A0AAV5JWM9_9ROSI|nr:hypothetical protein SLEP1_g26719 [Rubroshorea leprosula]